MTPEDHWYNGLSPEEREWWMEAAWTWQPVNYEIGRAMAINLAWCQTEEHRADPSIALARAYRIRDMASEVTR